MLFRSSSGRAEGPLVDGCAVEVSVAERLGESLDASDAASAVGPRAAAEGSGMECWDAGVIVPLESVWGRVGICRVAEGGGGAMEDLVKSW